MVVSSPRRLALVVTLLMSPGLAAAQDPADRLLERRDQLIATDKAAGDSAVRTGLAGALAPIADPDLILLYPGAPVIAGREAVAAMLAGQTALGGLTLRWAPLAAEVSADGDFGVSYGVTAIATSGGAGVPLRMGKYLSAWRHTAAGWRLIARSEVGLLPGGAFVAPAGFAAAGLAPLPRTGAVADFARADAAFATRAGKDGAPEAFAAFAAEDAVTFPGTGELARGPAAIRRWLSGPQAAWSWRPVAGGASAGGDLGFTVGESVITAPGEEPSYGKYLTLWRRDARGRIRFIGDGGNGRPAPHE